MTKPPRFYWDACAWLGLLNVELPKHRELEIVWHRAARGDCRIWTSALSRAEVFKKRCEDADPKPLSEENDKIIEEMLDQPFVKTAALNRDIGNLSRRLRRQFPGIRKLPDAIHLATAMHWNCDQLHTYDSIDLLALNGLVRRRDGAHLEICLPDVASDGPLFAVNKDLGGNA